MPLETTPAASIEKYPPQSRGTGNHPVLFWQRLAGIPALRSACL